MSDKHRERIARRMARFFNRLARNEHGVAAPEFGLVALPLFLLIMGIIEFGLLFFTQIALEHMVNDVAREATLGNAQTQTAEKPIDYIRKELKKRTADLIHGKNVIISVDVVNKKKSVYVQPELCLTNPPTYVATCNGPFEDTNGNGKYDAGSLGTDMGKGKDLLQIDVDLPWKFFTPFLGQFFKLKHVKNAEKDEDGKDKSYDAYVIHTSVLVTNEPF